MEKFNKITSTAVPLPVENVDTDQIIPARFLKATDREGFGDNLFRDWRYDEHDQPKPDFVLNNAKYQGSILIAGKKFRFRLKPGTCCLGAGGLWLPGCCIQLFCRYL